MGETSPISVDHHSIMRKMPADETSSASITRGNAILHVALQLSSRKVNRAVNNGGA